MQRTLFSCASQCGANGVEEEHIEGPRSLPPGIRPRGNAFVYDWRDATGKTFRRKAGDTIGEAIAYKAKIDAELNAGTFVAGSKTTFAEYAAHWIETYQLKSQTRRGYRSTP